MIGPYLKRIAPLNDGADPMIKTPIYFAGGTAFYYQWFWVQTFNWSCWPCWTVYPSPIEYERWL